MWTALPSKLSALLLLLMLGLGCCSASAQCCIHCGLDGPRPTAVSMLVVAIAVLAARGRRLELHCLHSLLHPRRS